MRNFEERKAEIFRRSNERIKERKRNRNRIMACCIPLCLCIAILSVIYLPDVMLFNDKSNSTEGMDIAGGMDGASEFTYTSVEITNNNVSSGNSKKECDITNVENIYNTIQSSFITEDEQQKEKAYHQFTDIQKGESAGKGENYGNSFQSGTITDTTANGFIYTITFSAYDGTQATYTLNGNKIIDESTKQEAILTDEQLLELQKALGLIITWEEDSK